MDPIRLLVVDDHTLFRRGLVALLSADASLQVVGEAGDASEAVRRAAQLQPDVILLDNHLPGATGVQALPGLKEAAPAARVVLLTVSEDEQDLRAALRGGAKGYLLKDSMRGEVIQAIRAVSEGRSFLTKKIARIMQEDYVSRLQQRGLEDRYDLLSDREREVLQMIAEGRSNKEVANLLNISLTTVETHRSHILQKLDIHSTPELILYAVRKGIIS